jgi:hypothetical protein
MVIWELSNAQLNIMHPVAAKNKTINKINLKN